jgi:hypothetical protein
MLFMVIERFRDNDMVPVYRRLRDGGRGLPEGLEYVDSWVEANFSRCFQLMRCDDLRLSASPFASGKERRQPKSVRPIFKGERDETQRRLARPRHPVRCKW